MLSHQHVLQEVGQSALVVVLLNGTHALGNVELGALLGPVVVTNVVGEPVVELSRPHVLVNGQGRHHLCHGHMGQEQHDGY